MTSREFRGIPSILEVECWGGYLNSDVKLISLQIFRLPETTILASLNVLTNNCMTFGDFSSCVVNRTDNHKSRVRVLVHDLKEGEAREYGCTANTVNPLGNSIYKNWKLLLVRKSKWAINVSVRHPHSHHAVRHPHPHRHHFVRKLVIILSSSLVHIHFCRV